jgi:hypothetical protein
MKRARKWSADKRAGEGRAAEPGGPLRRRRALRQLDVLALDPERELSPSAAHVRVIGEPAVPRVAARSGTDSVPLQRGPAREERGSAREEFGTVEAIADPAERRVHAVPIDQPFDVPSRSVATDR